jgi:hypothetical protein
VYQRRRGLQGEVLHRIRVFVSDLRIVSLWCFDCDWGARYQSDEVESLVGKVSCTLESLLGVYPKELLRVPTRFERML